MPLKLKLDQLNFTNSYSKLPNDFFSFVKPNGFSKPKLVALNKAALHLIDLDPNEVNHPDFIHYFCGNKKLNGGINLATVYSGHQFGHYVSQLGDGRAILLGEIVNNRGEPWEIQLKGAGKTPYSRMGDGRAVLRSSIREYLCSEAMHSLGIPTSRALCIIGSDEDVTRETIEKAATITRLAPTHLRFGHFEYFYYSGQHQNLKILLDYLLNQHFPGISDQEDRYNLYFQIIVTRTAKLIAKWQAVGFAHGVMNTDNMSAIGLTIDYGPFGFMEEVNLGFICNHSDYTGRYAFDQQPSIALWNLHAFAKALSPLLPLAKSYQHLKAFEGILTTHYTHLMRNKLGLQVNHQDDIRLITGFIKILVSEKLDYTNSFRLFSHSPLKFKKTLRNPAQFDIWYQEYLKRTEIENTSPEERKTLMLSHNPAYILRNYLAAQAITQAEQGDYSEINKLLQALQHPFMENNKYTEYSKPPPAWAKDIAISCSS